MKILNDPTLLFDNERFSKKIEEVKKDKQGILNAANDYNNRFRNEIDEGTKKRRLLIEDGERRGLKEEDIMSQVGYFVPCRQTPILNFLYFMLREENIDIGLEENRKKFNIEFGHLEDDYEYKKSGNVEEPEEMDTFIYGNMSHDMFKKIKKLKALSRSVNENEAFIAYRMCLELCERFGLEFDKIPCDIKKE
jgi:hypothetical protein